jgi:hypothetical protein
VEVILPVSNQELASQIGTVRELVSRNLSRFQSEGLVTIDGRIVTIHVKNPSFDDGTGTRIRWGCIASDAPSQLRVHASGRCVRQLPDTLPGLA